MREDICRSAEVVCELYRLARLAASAASSARLGHAELAEHLLVA